MSKPAFDSLYNKVHMQLIIIFANGSVKKYQNYIYLYTNFKNLYML